MTRQESVCRTLGAGNRCEFNGAYNQCLTGAQSEGTQLSGVKAPLSIGDGFIEVFKKSLPY